MIWDTNFFNKYFTNYARYICNTDVPRDFYCMYSNPWGADLCSIDSCSHTKAFACVASEPVPPGAPEWFDPDLDFEGDFD